MLTWAKGNRGDLTDRPFAFDNGCFSQPERYNDARYLAWLDGRNRDGCLFATAPDRVGDWRETLSRSLPMLPRIRALGFPAAFICQDGQPEDVIPWDACDAIFVGGTTQYKLSEAAYRLPALAHARGKWAHMGRVNSRIRYRAARVAGYDSADGNMLVYGREVNWERVMGWLEDEERQPSLFAG
jgi:hypothetical protein